MASSGAEGPIAVAQHGLLASQPMLALIGEAGAEAVVPLKGGVIPTTVDALGRLLAVIPSGDQVPIRLPAMAMGGVVGSGEPIVPTPPAVSPGIGARPGAMDKASGVTINNHWTIQTPDVAGFRASESQIMTSYALALERARRRHG